MKRSGELRGRAFIDGAIVEDVLIRWERGVITEVTPESGIHPHPNRGVTLILPGFIDVHVHGGDGADFLDGSEAAVRRVLAFHATCGTTTLAATTLTADSSTIERSIDAIVAVSRAAADHEAEIGGIHLEGPYVSPERAGAQDRESIRSGDPDELARWIGRAGALRCMITVAPEIEGVKLLMAAHLERVLFSIGHTSADFGTTADALERGAAHFTHLFNAMPPLHHRDPGPIGAAMVSASATIELIADGIHLHPAILSVMARMMPHRIALVTDAMRAAGSPDGSYKLHRHEVIVRDGAARLSNGSLAGSVLTMIDAVRNMVELAGVPIEQVIPMATTTPARILRLEKRKGKIAVGMDADLLVLSPKFEILKTVIRGTPT